MGITVKEYINNCKLESENYFLEQKRILERSLYSYLERDVFHVHFHHSDGPYYPSYPLSAEQQEKRDLFDATILGTALFAIGAFIAQSVISDLINKTVSFYDHKHHLDLASQSKTENYAYFSIAQDMTDIHSLKTAYIHKHAMALFLLMSGSAILMTAGFSAAPLLIPTGKAFLLASMALGVFTELWHRSDTIAFNKGYDRISHVASNYLS